MPRLHRLTVHKVRDSTLSTDLTRLADNEALIGLVTLVAELLAVYLSAVDLTRH